jgi:hypothetical protein
MVPSWPPPRRRFSVVDHRAADQASGKIEERPQASTKLGNDLPINAIGGAEHAGGKAIDE